MEEIESGEYVVSRDILHNNVVLTEEIEDGNIIIDNFVHQFNLNINYFGLYHRDWNALMIACDIWDEIMDIIPNEYLPVYINISDNVDNDITTHNIMATFRTLMWAIIWYNNICLLQKVSTDRFIIEKPKKFKI